MTAEEVEAAEALKETNKGKGARKVGLGFVSLFTPWVGIGIGAVGAASFVVGSILRGVGWATGSEGLSNGGKNFQSMGVKAVVTGAVLSNPLTGFALMCEGAYQGVVGEELSIRGYKIGFEAIARKSARFLTRDFPLFGKGGTELPQLGDPGHDPNEIWQKSSKASHELDGDVELPQRQQTHSSQQPQHQTSQQQHSQGEHDQVGSRPEPVAQNAAINITAITKATDYQKASEVYAEQVNKQPDQKFAVDPKSVEHLDDGVMKVTYVPPQFKDDPSKCPPDQRVTQTFDKDGYVTKVEPGKETSCVTPPVKKGASFEIHSYENGQQQVHNSHAIESAKKLQTTVGSRGASSSLSPPPGGKTKEDGHSI